EGLETNTEAALGLPDPLGDRPDLPLVRAEEHDHPIGLAEWIGPQNDALVMPNRHGVRVFGLCVKHLATLSCQEPNARDHRDCVWFESWDSSTSTRSRASSPGTRTGCSRTPPFRGRSSSTTSPGPSSS